MNRSDPLPTRGGSAAPHAQGRRGARGARLGANVWRRRPMLPCEVVVEPIADMPAGTLGFRVSGRISREEYFQMLDPVHELLEQGEKVSFLVQTDADFRGLDLAALWEDTKAAGSVGLKYRTSWDRLAVVTDKDWLRHAVAAFGWVSPGELRVFEPAQLEDAKAWTGGATVVPEAPREDGGHT
jgi:hypothetical protein